MRATRKNFQAHKDDKDKGLKLTEWTCDIDRAEWKQIYWQAWRDQRLLLRCQHAWR